MYFWTNDLKNNICYCNHSAKKWFRNNGKESGAVQISYLIRNFGKVHVGTDTIIS